MTATDFNDTAIKQTVVHAFADHTDRLRALDDDEVFALARTEIDHLRLYEVAYPADALFRLGGYVAEMLIRQTRAAAK